MRWLRRADADEHLDKIRARNREEGNVGFARDCARQQRLAGSRRPHQQHAAWNAPAQTLEFSGIAQEFDNLLEILLRFVDARHVLERDAAVRFGQKLGPALAEPERLAARSLHLPGEEYPNADERDERKPRDQERHKPGHVVLLRARSNGNALGVEALDQGRIVGRIGLEAAPIREGAVNFRPLDQDVAHTALVHFIEQLGERDVLGGRALARILEEREKREQQEDDDHP